DDALGVPVPVVAAVPVPRDDLAPRYQRVTGAPMGTGQPTGTIATAVARAERGVGVSGLRCDQPHGARHHHSGYEPRQPVHHRSLHQAPLRDIVAPASAAVSSTGVPHLVVPGAMVT